MDDPEQTSDALWAERMSFLGIGHFYDWEKVGEKREKFFQFFYPLHLTTP
jgi:hypothetical protein